MKDILLGDKIRVTREFTVTQVSSTHIGDDIGLYSFERNDFEILEKRPPQVGDVVFGVKAYADLPVGAVLEDEFLGPIVRVATGFIRAAAPAHVRSDGWFSDHRKLVYVP